MVGARGPRPEGVCRIVYNPGKSQVKVYLRQPCTPGGQEEEREDGVVGGVGLRQDLAYPYPGG